MCLFVKQLREGMHGEEASAKQHYEAIPPDRPHPHPPPLSPHPVIGAMLMTSAVISNFSCHLYSAMA